MSRGQNYFGRSFRPLMRANTFTTMIDLSILSKLIRGQKSHKSSVRMLEVEGLQ